MKESIKALWEKHPLVLIVSLGLFFRLLAVIFSKGYGMSDDHFLVIEPAQAWADGYDYNHWLPSGGAQTPDGHSLFYSGLHYFIFRYLNWRGLTDPQGKMYIIRLLHALWSLLVITLGFKIAKEYAGEKVAKQVGMILALLWFFPMFAVRNLVEVVCIPPLMLATWFLIDPARKEKVKTYLWIGFWCGIAFNIRFQSALFIAGIGFIILFSKKWKNFFAFAIGGIVTVFALQGVVDMIVWKRPFAELTGYVTYNIVHANDYIIGSWYNYLLLIGGLLIPPVSLFIIFGFGRSWKKYPVLFWPTFLFFFFHSLFPNKQERFIMPVIPFIIILGCIGWAEYVAQSGYWQKHTKLLKNCWVFFWVLNLIVLPFISVTYSKKSRVESMTYLSHKKDIRNILVDGRPEDGVPECPLYYLGDWNIHVVKVTSKANEAKAYYTYMRNDPPSLYPNYAIFYGIKDIDSRVADFKKMYPDATYLTTIYPSFIDRVMTFLNPVNENENAYIYHFDQIGMNIPAPKDTL